VQQISNHNKHQSQIYNELKSHPQQLLFMEFTQ